MYRTSSTRFSVPSPTRIVLTSLRAWPPPRPRWSPRTRTERRAGGQPPLAAWAAQTDRISLSARRGTDSFLGVPPVPSGFLSAAAPSRSSGPSGRCGWSARRLCRPSPTVCARSSSWPVCTPSRPSQARGAWGLAPAPPRPGVRAPPLDPGWPGIASRAECARSTASRSGPNGGGLRPTLLVRVVDAAQETAAEGHAALGSSMRALARRAAAVCGVGGAR